MDETANTERRRPAAVRLRRWLSLLILAYFAALFWGTHTRKPPRIVSEGVSDKYLHFLAYGGLAFLVASRLACNRRPTWRRHAKLWLVIAVYGVLDEFLQIPVGRDAEFADWLMDATGAATGLLACAIIVSWLERRFKPSHPAPASRSQSPAGD